MPNMYLTKTELDPKTLADFHREFTIAKDCVTYRGHGLASEVLTAFVARNGSALVLVGGPCNADEWEVKKGTFNPKDDEIVLSGRLAIM